jgi:hypothetical protein
MYEYDRLSTESGTENGFMSGGKSSNSRTREPGEIPRVSRRAQSQKQSFPMNSTDAGSVNEVRRRHSSNADFSIRASFESGGNITLSRQAHCSKH